MKQGSFLKVLAGAALALTLISGSAVASDTKSKDKHEVLYPNATRQEPKTDLTDAKEAKTLNEGLDAANNGDADKANQILQPLIDSSKSKYAQAIALQGLANIKYNAGDIKGAIALLNRSLDIGVMPNDTYFQLQFMLAQFYMADEQYQQALTTLQKWRDEGKKETADSYGVEGNIDYRLGKYPEAIAAIKKAQSMTDKPQDAWNQILLAAYADSGKTDEAANVAQEQLQKNPNDVGSLRNAVSLLLQQQKYADAIKLMEQARAKGLYTDEKDYMNMAKVYLISAQESSDPKAGAAKAVQVIDEGVSKGIVKPGYDAYKLQGDAAYVGEDHAKALESYRKAVPFAKDGEADMRVAQLLLEGEKAGEAGEAKKFIQDAINKGVQHKGSAYMLLAESERELKNKPAAIAAMKQAAQDPETAAKANAWLKTAGTK